MIYELRVYQSVSGRLNDLLKRFETLTLKFWNTHGITPVGFWTTVIGESNQTLYYMLKWESLAEREHKWKAFSTDKDWLVARAETERDGPLVATYSNAIIEPTTFSAMK